MSENCLENALIKQIDYLVASLLDFFREPKNEHRWFHAAKIANNQVSRTARPQAPNLEKRFVFFASKLKNNITAPSLRNFASECLTIAEKMGAFGKEKPVNVAESPRHLQKKAQKDLSQMLASGHSETAALNRVANNLLKNKRQQETVQRLATMTKSHPLKETLQILQKGEHPLAKEDIRHQLLRLKRKANPLNQGDGILFGLLERAQAFSAPRIHQLLGDELFFLCRPLGFLDQTASTLVVEVPTSAHLHALTYRKLEILKALKKDVAFRTARNIRFRVTGSAF